MHRAIIGIESNKRDAIEILSTLTEGVEDITVQALKVQYPQGGERQLIEALLGREVPSGGLPHDVGVIVHNVGTTYSIYLAVQKNQPLIERVVTVTGKDVEKPSNFMVRIGTPVAEVIAAAGGVPTGTGKIISGGPMMGKALDDSASTHYQGDFGIIADSRRGISSVGRVQLREVWQMHRSLPHGAGALSFDAPSQRKKFGQGERRAHHGLLAMRLLLVYLPF